jgi:hypothetical protein
MNCKQSERAMIVSVFGTPREEERTALKEHLSRCRKCARRWEQTRDLRKKTDRIPSFSPPDPDRSWTVISHHLSQRRRLPYRRRNWMWAPAAAALLIVFVAGFFFGRRLFLVPPAALTQASLDLSEVSFESYADYLQPVLVDFLNRNGVQNPESVRGLEQRIVSDLLDRTRLFKSLIPEDGSPALGELLQDLELILTAIDNLEPGDRDTARHLAGLIREKDVSLRLQQLIRTQFTL